MKHPFIHLITKGEAHPGNFAEKKCEILDIVALTASSRITHIQIREKQLPARLLFDLSAAAAKIISKTETQLVINGRADIALAAGAAGVHLPANSLLPAMMRDAFPKNFLIGVSTHSLQEAENASLQGADYITFGPVFASPDKGEPKGLQELAQVCERLAEFQVIALGGIDETNFQNVLNTGASGFAAIRFLNDCRNFELLSDY